MSEVGTVEVGTAEVGTAEVGTACRGMTFFDVAILAPLRAADCRFNRLDNDSYVEV